MATAYKVLGQNAPSATTLTDLYTVPALTSVVASTLLACNRSGTPSTYRVSVAVAGAADATKQYIVYDATLNGNETQAYTIGVTLAASDVVRVYTANATVSFTLFGSEIS
jgi:hypothetical protein